MGREGALAPACGGQWPLVRAAGSATHASRSGHTRADVGGRLTDTREVSAGPDGATGSGDRERAGIDPGIGVCGIVLAGGRASRFGGDKLSATVGSRPLLALAIDALVRICDEVVVTIAPRYRPPPFPAGPRLVADPAAHEGPVSGIFSGAAATKMDVLLVVGGDMPTLEPAVLEMLVAATCSSGLATALGLGVDDSAQPLPHALCRAALSGWLGDGSHRGSPSLRSFLRSIDCRVIPEATWRRIDPAGRTIRDVDRRSDLLDASRLRE